MLQTIFVSPGEDLQAVFDRAPEGALIHMAPGIYRQKTVIRTPGLTLMGAGADSTRIVFDDYSKKTDDRGREYITFRSYTMAVCADGVTLRDLTVANDAGDPHIKGQQVALSVVADGFAMENCVLSSTQDTLFTGPLPPDLQERYRGFLMDDLCRGGELRQYFQNCRIEGTVDFIFGCGNAVFENCELRSVYDARGIGYVAAPAHRLFDTQGYLFKNCRMTRDDGVADASIYLARPWRDHGLCSFENCVYGPHIAPEGFDKWANSQRDKTARFRESPAVAGRASWVNQR